MEQNEKHTMPIEGERGEIVLYQPDENISLEVRLEEETVWLPQAVHDRYLIIDHEVWLLGASVKDMGRGLCTIIKLGFTPEEILSRV